MSAPSLIARLGLDPTDFKIGLKASQESLKSLQDEAKVTAAQIAFLEREMLGAGTDVQRKKHADLQTSLRTTQLEAKKTANQLAAIDAVSGKKSSPGGNMGELAHSARGITDMMLAGQSPMQAAIMEMPRILQGMGGGLGTIIGVGALAGIATKLFEAHEEAKKLREEIEKIGLPMPQGAAASLDAIKARLKEVGETRAKLEASQTSLIHGYLNWFNPYSGNADDQAEAEDAQTRGVDGERAGLTHQLADRQGIENNLDRRGFENGEDTVAADRIRNSYAQEYADIEKRVTAGELSADSELVKRAQERRDLEIAAEQRKQAAAARQAELEERILAIKKAGVDVEVQIAKVRLEAAQKALDAGPKDGNEHRQLEQHVGASAFEIEQAERARTEKTSRSELETQIARLRGSSDQVRKGTLDAQQADIHRRLVSPETKADEMPGLSADWEKNAQQQAEFAKQQKLREIDTSEKGDAAKFDGNSLSDKLALLNRELEHVGERRTWNDTENGGDKAFGADLDKHFADLKKAIDDVTFAEQARLTALQNEETHTRHRGYQPTQADHDRDTDEKFNAEVKAEEHGHNDPATLDQIERNRKAEHFENAVDEAALTPDERAARTAHNNRRAGAEARVGSAERRHAEVEAANVGDFDTRFHAKVTVPSRMDAIHAAAANAGKGDAAPTVDNAGIIGAINNPSWASKLDFRNKA